MESSTEATPLRDETRARILAVALELFAERGFAATSTREVSERLGFTKAALYYHFRTKEDLLDALVRPVLDEMETLVGSAPAEQTPAARRSLLRGMIDLISAHEDVVRVVSQDPSARHRPPLARAELIFQRFIELLTGAETLDVSVRMRAAVVIGGIAAALSYAEPDDDPEAVREGIFAAACGALDLPVA